MRKLLSCLFCTMVFAAANAQKISGSIKEDNGKSSNGATISLLRAKDSGVVKYTVTKDDGKFEFSGITAGNYLVSASHIGYTPQYSSAIQLSGSDVSVPPITLNKISAELKAVTVTAKKPMVEVKADKMILNVEGTINAVGTDALELLRKSPGVLVDKDDNLSLSGKNGVQVYVDGRPTPLSGKDLSDYLKSLQSANIEAVEIITNPSAKYEAAGNAGIINIRLKKNKSLGTNGSVNAGWAIGTYPKYNAGIALNNRNKRTNIFGNYNYNDSKNLNAFNLYRIAVDTIFDQRSRMIMDGINHSYKAGMDVFINKRSTLGFVINGGSSTTDIMNRGKTDISYQPTNTLVKILEANNSNHMTRNNTNFNGNYRYTDTSGRELNVDADYGFYNLNSDQMQPNIYYDAAHQNELSRVVYNMIAPTGIDIYSLKADYEQNYKKGRLGIGGKSSYVSSDNDFQRYNVYGSGKQLDTLRSNRFDYKEKINALYVNYNRPFKGFMVQAGLRMENTDSKGHSAGFTRVNNAYKGYDSTFERNYTDFFPSMALTFNKNPMSQVSLTYSRRVDRPAYQDLNPFEFKLDEYTFQKGNTQLRPQYTNSFGVTHTYHYKLNTTLNYSHVKDIFSQLVDTTEKSKTFITKKNLATQDIVSLNISYPFQYKKFSSFINLNSYYSKYKADLGAAASRKINLDVFSFNVYMQNGLKLSKTLSAELSGFYTAPSIWQGTFKSIGMGGIDIGLQQTVLKGKGNLKASLSDVFKTMRWSGESNFAGQYTHAYGNWESRQFKLNFSYRFGNSQVKAARQRKSALEEEAKRTQGGGGGIGQ
ncbi:MAG: outer rane beta-barrel protein [Ferruginibacter sp.]|nr:outer rane beta-barrel protein [Ferruginibacter sp.]